MSLNIFLENEHGEQLEEIVDSSNLFLNLIKEKDLKESSCLRFIDPYGDTVFNRLHIGQFLDELDSLDTLVGSVEESNLLISIKELAHRCEKGVHLYIKIYGD